MHKVIPDVMAIIARAGRRMAAGVKRVDGGPVFCQIHCADRYQLAARLLRITAFGHPVVTNPNEHELI